MDKVFRTDAIQIKKNASITRIDEYTGHMKQTLFVLALLFLTAASVAQNYKQGELQFNHLFVKDGMPEGRVNALVQDKEGYMWIATQKGLVRYDGYKPKVYNFEIENPYSQDIGSLYIDKEDRLWVGGVGFLFLYDRSEDRFIKYSSDLSVTGVSAFSSSFSIWAIQEGRRNEFWLDTYDFVNKKDGIERFDLATKKFIPFGKNGKGYYNINAGDYTELFKDGNGTVWESSGNGINRYNEKTDLFDRFLASADSAKQLTFYSFVSRKGILWMGAHETQLPSKAEGLWAYDEKTNEVTVHRHQSNDPFSLANDDIHWIYNDALGRLWITTDNGLSIFDPVKNSFINYPLRDNNSGNFIALNEIAEDKTGNLWMTTFNNQGLASFNTYTREFTFFAAHEKDPYGLANNYVHRLFIDRSGTLWFGAAQLGLEWINNPLSRFVHYKDDPGQLHHFPGGVVNSFAEAKDSTIWLGTAHGLYHWRPLTDSFTFVKINENQEKNFSVETAIIDKAGEIWCGVTHALHPGLYRYDPATGKTQYYTCDKKDTTSLGGQYVSKLLEDHLGNIWVGTYGGGISRFNRVSRNFTRYPFIAIDASLIPKPGSLDDGMVLSLYEDKTGTLWAGTNWGGLNRLDRETGTFTSYRERLPGFQCVLSIYGDDNNKIWAGTYFGGVYSFDPQTNLTQKYTEKNNLLYDGANGIVQDKQGNLWLASERGISVFNPQTKQVRGLTSANGLPTENLIGAFKTSSGRFLFSSNDGGFISLNPDDFTPDPRPPAVHIESVDFVISHAGYPKDSTLVTWGKDSISFRYNENRLSFHYVGIYYQNPQLNQYACKLDGYDKDWIIAGTQRTATYTNLSPGSYTFHVKASNSDGVWNEQGDSFSFTILPPWWRTWWAYTLYILVFGLSVWAFAAYRSRNLRRANQVLEEKVAHRTRQLNQSIDELKSTQSQLIQSEKMASLGELTAGIAHEIQNPLNFVNNFSEVNKELIEEASQANNAGNSLEVNELLSTLKENEEKIIHHGKRADAIVKGMLQHSRSSTGKKELADINALADEYLRLSYHGLRAKDKSFNAVIKTDLDKSIGMIPVVPQDIGRVILNLINNAFYAVTEKKKSSTFSDSSKINFSKSKSSIARSFKFPFRNKRAVVNYLT